MTLVGHTLTGMAIGVCLLPSPLRSRQGMVGVLFCGVLANLPDLPVHGWGHDAYHVSHSIFVNLGLGVIAWTLIHFGRHLANVDVSARLQLAGLFAWMSHFLLDTFYSHGKGVRLFWPVSDARLALPIPVFDTLGGWPPAMNGHTARVFGIELAAYGVLLGAVCFMRWTRKSAT